MAEKIIKKSIKQTKMTYEQATEILREQSFKVTVNVDAVGDGSYKTTGIQVDCNPLFLDNFKYRINKLLKREFRLQFLPNKDSLLIEKKVHPVRTIN